MAIQMTRAEYEKKYGTPPATTPTTPPKMTQAEYDAKYGKNAVKPKDYDVTKSTSPLDYYKRSTSAYTDAAVDAAKGVAKTYSDLPGKLVEDVKAGAEDMKKGGLGNIFKGVVKSGARVAGDAAGAVFAPITAVVGGAADSITRQVPQIGTLFNKGVNTVADKVSESPELQKFAVEHPNAGEDVNRALNLIPGAGERGRISPKAIFGEAKDSAVSVATKVKEATAPIPLLDKSKARIVERYEKGIKPLLPGKTTPTQVNKYKDDVFTAVNTIKQNKEKLSFGSDVGEPIVGRTPESLQQLSEAVEQTKKEVFREYDALAKEAGDAGVTVRMEPIAKELDSVIGNKALAITNPRAIQYARALKQRLESTGKLDAITAQDVIQNYNKSLEAFYRNPSYDTASQAAVDAMVANLMRKSLDDGISGLTGSRYGELKSKYGSLKAVERDVIKATLRDARKNTKGLIDFTDIFSGGQLISGVLSLNPAMIAQGASMKAIAAFYKHLNSPNRAVKMMFEEAEKLP